MEYTGTCHAIRKAEILAQLLVENDMADIVKKVKKDKVSVRVYQIYVGKEMEEVNIRFWYDERYDKACFKLTDDGWNAIMQSGTVLSGLMALGKTINKNGNGFSMLDLEDLLKSSLKKLAENKLIEEEALK